MPLAPPDMLADIGRALHGENWRKPLSRDLQLNDETLRRWMSGRQELPADHGVFRDAMALIVSRKAALYKAGIDLDMWMEGQARG